MNLKPLKMPESVPKCEHCGKLTWGGRCDCTKSKKLRRTLIAWFDMDSDGELTVDDVGLMVVRHEWMFLAGLFIFLGSALNVAGYTQIDPDAFWACAGLAAMLEYIDDVRRNRR